MGNMSASEVATHEYVQPIQTEAEMPIGDEIQERLQETELAYSATLRQLAKARLHDRREAAANGHDFNTASWQPNAEHIAQDPDPRAQRLARHLFISRNVAQFDPTNPNLPFYEHQVDPFRLILNFLSGYRRPKDSAELHTQISDIINGGFAKLPPGFGKTLDIIFGSVAAGVGQRLPGSEDSARPIRSLCLVPTRRILHQTVGEKQDAVSEDELTIDEIDSEKNTEETDEEEDVSTQEVMSGFADFAPHLNVQKYYRGNNERNKNSDVLVMTYHAFNLATRAGRIDPSDFDLIFADEAHCVLGERTMETLAKYTRDGVRVVGLSGSDTYGQGRNVTNVLRNEICNLSFRDQIDLGKLPPVQLLRIATNGEIKARHRKALDYELSELRSLAQDEERNQQGLDWVQLLVEQGRRVFVPSIPGVIDDKSCWHARHLAAKMAERDVYDGELGDYRKARTEVLGSFQSYQEQDEILQRWEKGLIDAMFTVNMLGVGWSSSRLDAIVDLAPTTSPVRMDQRLGRLTRGSDEWPLKVYVAFMDNVRGNKPQYTPWHSLEEDVIDADAIIGSPSMYAKEWAKQKRRSGQPEEDADDNVDDETQDQGADLDETAPKPKGFVDINNLPKPMRSRIAPQYMLVEEATISQDAIRYKDPSPNYVPLAEHHAIWKKLGLSATCTLLKAHGYPYEIARGKRGPMRHVHEDGIAFLKNYKIPEVATSEHHTASSAESLLGISAPYIHKLAKELGIEMEERISSKMRVIQLYYLESDLRRIAVLNAERSKLDDGDEAVRHIAAEFGLEVTSAQYYMATRFNPPIEGKSKMMPSHHEAIVVKAEDAERLRALFKSMVVTKENGRHTITMIMKKSGKSRTAVLRSMREVGADQRQKEGLYKHPDTKKMHFAKYINRADSEKVLHQLGVVTGEVTPIDDALTVLNCTAAAFPILCATAHVTLNQLGHTENGVITGIPAAVMARLQAVRLPRPTEGWVRHGRLEELSKETGNPIPPLDRVLVTGERKLCRRTSPPVAEVYYDPKTGAWLIARIRNPQGRRRLE